MSEEKADDTKEVSPQETKQCLHCCGTGWEIDPFYLNISSKCHKCKGTGKVKP